MSVQTLMVASLGLAATNCYILADDTTKEAILIDPCDDAPLLKQTLDERGWSLKLILATHGHFDHVLASAPLKDMTGAPFWIHERDSFFLDSLPEQGLRFVGRRFPPAAPVDRWLTDEPETIRIGAITLETLHTPGHAPGHVSFLWREGNAVFSGDCLFEGSIGRTDLPGADYDQLMQTITDRLLPLGDDVQVMCGHGRPTTIGAERRHNPFILSYLSG